MTQNKTQVNLKNRIIVALDTADFTQAKSLVKTLKRDVPIFKIGSELFTACGPRAIQMVRESGREVFLDLKFHDIPNTVHRSVRAAIQYEVAMLTIHVSGGLRMMQEACVAAADEAQKKNLELPKLIGVTLLTSLSEEDVKNEIGLSKPIQETVLRYAGLAQRAGLDGIVASAFEIKRIREHYGPDFLIVTPGVRPEGASRDDQERVLTPKEAFDLGASYIVMGRPITQATSPADAMARVIQSLT